MLARRPQAHPTVNRETRREITSALRVKVELLRRFEMGERALAEVYRRQGGESRWLARLHDEHAALLRARLSALDAAPRAGIDDQWLRGEGDEALRVAEYVSLATYHDHLTNLDPESARIVREVILPEHDQALALLDPEHSRRRPL
jgi:hypothetical protein